MPSWYGDQCLLAIVPGNGDEDFSDALCFVLVTTMLGETLYGDSPSPCEKCSVGKGEEGSCSLLRLFAMVAIDILFINPCLDVV